VLAIPGGPAAYAAKPGVLTARHEHRAALFAISPVRQLRHLLLATAQVVPEGRKSCNGEEAAGGQPQTGDGWLVNRAAMILPVTGAV
jgi:hypothetical protein